MDTDGDTDMDVDRDMDVDMEVDMDMDVEGYAAALLSFSLPFLLAGKMGISRQTTLDLEIKTMH